VLTHGGVPVAIGGPDNRLVMVIQLPASETYLARVKSPMTGPKTSTTALKCSAGCQPPNHSSDLTRRA
jgi:hypothetical protein